MRDNYGACRGKVQYAYIAYTALCSQLQHETLQLKEVVDGAKGINSNPDVVFDPATTLKMVEDFDRINEMIVDTEIKLSETSEDLTTRVS